jgi:hypothetical protein
MGQVRSFDNLNNNSFSSHHKNLLLDPALKDFLVRYKSPDFINRTPKIT